MYLSWLRQHQTGILLLLKHGVIMVRTQAHFSSFCVAWLNLPPLHTIQLGLMRSHLINLCSTCPKNSKIPKQWMFGIVLQIFSQYVNLKSYYTFSTCSLGSTSTYFFYIIEYIGVCMYALLSDYAVVISWLFCWLRLTPSISSSMVDMVKLVSARSGDFNFSLSAWFSFPWPTHRASSFCH